MESKGQILVALSVIAVLAGFSAIGYIAVQQNANVTSRAASVTAPDIASSAGTGTTGVGSAGSGSTPETVVGGSCVTAQDCVNMAVARGFCTAGSACPADGGSYECIATKCAITGATVTGTPGTTAAPTSSLPTCSTKSSGDFDCNGRVDCADLTLFVTEFTGVLTTKTSDSTGDGKVSLADFEKGRVGGAWVNCQL